MRELVLAEETHKSVWLASDSVVTNLGDCVRRCQRENESAAAMATSAAAPLLKAIYMDHCSPFEFDLAHHI